MGVGGTSAESRMTDEPLESTPRDHRKGSNLDAMEKARRRLATIETVMSKPPNDDDNVKK